MFDRLDAIVERYNKINELLQDPQIASDVKKLRDLSKELGSLDKIVSKYKEYQEIQKQIEDLKLMAKDEDEEIVELALVELEELKPKLPALEEELKSY